MLQMTGGRFTSAFDEAQAERASHTAGLVQLDMRTIGSIGWFGLVQFSAWSRWARTLCCECARAPIFVLIFVLAQKLQTLKHLVMVKK